MKNDGLFENRCPVARPIDLPDFAAPPLTEVAISLQFDTLSNYSAVWAGPLWQMFRTQFPRVQEQLPLAPAFETFGGGAAIPAINFSIMGSPIQTRLWFLNDDDTELLQFQNDRFGRNWRKQPPLDNSYPRFESMIADFERDVQTLSNFCAENRIGNLVPNQCELTYVNFVELSRLSQARIEPSTVFSNLAFRKAPRQFQLNFSFELTSEARPYGRIHAHCGTIVRPTDNVEGIGITLTGRGTPSSPDLRSSINRLCEFRDCIVRQFDEMTTDIAHSLWGRV